jgi:hypothetical protein
MEQVLPRGGGWYQWEEGGVRESVQVGGYSTNTVYPCM